MKTNLEPPSPLDEKVARLEAKLENLAQEIKEIGMPAAQDLKRRFDALQIEENALKRNIEESRQKGEPDSLRLRKIDALLHHIEHEESAVEHEADFLHQAAPSSVTLVAQAGVHMVDLYRRGVKRVLGDHHPLGSSVFVNHTHENLVTDYGLTPTKAMGPEKTL